MSQDAKVVAADSTKAERLATLRAQTAEIEAARAKRYEERSPEEELAQAEIELADAKALQAAEEVHGALGVKIAQIKTRLGCVILKRSNHLLFRRFQELDEIKATDLEKLVRPCLVYPDAARFDELVTELPAVLAQCATEISVLAGVRRKELSGKS